MRPGVGCNFLKLSLKSWNNLIDLFFFTLRDKWAMLKRVLEGIPAIF
ncbi:hypothetical protein H206_02307 [Candidatus Electrothrix aarhusensis]|jgi:hypothetical protein|uniref:Uncharacterized protein n=1 Tax=Candidatus Electrothrix aarhusensis TaxID=1859131 RepID=A0A3S3SPI9_9BACT|nr:hypothetical protein H206_02307 [Candidatus Electrothrix aarhusensis]